MYRHITDVSDSLYLLVNGKVYLTGSTEDLEYLVYANL